MKEGFLVSTNIKGQEVREIMETFWGKDNPIASTYEQAESFDSALRIVNRSESFDDAKAFIISELGGKKISIGIESEGRLAAHSGLIIKPWGEVECGGSIVVPEYRGKHLIGTLNELRRALLKRMALLGFQPTSFLLIGSVSMHYGAELFDFDDIGMKTYFCNFGPYIYNRSTDLAQGDEKKVSEFSWKTAKTIVSSSTQVIGIRSDRPPKIDDGISDGLPLSAKELLDNFPREIVARTEIEGENSIRHSPAKISISVLRKPYEDSCSILPEIKKISTTGNNVIIQIPLQEGSNPIIQQIMDVLCKDYKGVMLIPTGLTVINGYWAITFASIPSDHLMHYKSLMEKVTKISDSLKPLAYYSLKALT